MESLRGVLVIVARIFGIILIYSSTSGIFGSIPGCIRELRAGDPGEKVGQFLGAAMILFFGLVPLLKKDKRKKSDPTNGDRE